MVGLLTWLLRLSGWSAARLGFGPATAEGHEDAPRPPQRGESPDPASFSDVALASLGERVAWLCLTLLMAARVTACFGWRCDRPGVEPTRAQDAPRGPPPSR
jgi:hypothetical protein